MELAVIDQVYELMLWAHNHVVKFPRHSRFSIGTRLEDTLGELMDCLVEAKYSRQKVDPLRRAGLLLEQFRIRLRLCKDTRLISINSHHFAIHQVVEIGRQIQSWRKYQGAADLT